MCPLKLELKLLTWVDEHVFYCIRCRFKRSIISWGVVTLGHQVFVFELFAMMAKLILGFILSIWSYICTLTLFTWSLFANWPHSTCLAHCLHNLLLSKPAVSSSNSPLSLSMLPWERLIACMIVSSILTKQDHIYSWRSHKDVVSMSVEQVESVGVDPDRCHPNRRIKLD